MAKLQLLIEVPLDGDNGGHLTHLTKLFKAYLLFFKKFVFFTK